MPTGTTSTLSYQECITLLENEGNHGKKDENHGGGNDDQEDPLTTIELVPTNVYKAQGKSLIETPLIGTSKANM